MRKYIDADALTATAQYFREREYSKPEQIGLFLYFKAAGINNFGFAEYKKWGDYDQTERERLLRRLYDLAGIFDESYEMGLKYTALFPFSITRHYKTTSYYNGGSPFKTLGSRISDTLDNALIGTLMVRDSSQKAKIKFTTEYLTVLKSKYLKGQSISLGKIASWCYRFWYIDSQTELNSREMTDVLILSFLMDYNISLEEFKNLFSFDNFEISSLMAKISGDRLRAILDTSDGECCPEISNEKSTDYMPIQKGLSQERVKELLDLRGNGLTPERIESILVERDNELRTKMEWSAMTDIERAIVECWKTKAFDYIDVVPLYKEFKERFGKDAIRGLSGKETLYRLFGRKEDVSLVYSLEHLGKYNYFGGIGGFRTIYTLYEKDGEWHYCKNAKNVKTVTEDEAIQIAVEYRNGLVALFDRLDVMIGQNEFARMDGFSKLKDLITSTAGSVLYNRNWVWKYFHMLYPDVFMNVYSSEWINKVFRVAQIVPANNYPLQCGQFSLLAQKLKIRNVYLYHILQALDDAEETENNEEVEDMSDNTNNIENNLPIREPRAQRSHGLNRILYGAPGTGKTYATAEYAMAVIENRMVDLRQKTEEERKTLMRTYREKVADGQIVFTTFHQSYGYEDFIQGLRPDNDSEKLRFIPVDGVFKRIADKAMADAENDYVIIIDEINRANISKVFGELITLIEEDKRWGEVNAISVTLPSGEQFAVPNNLYIIGTMNSADKSISLIDTALRRRFEFIEVTPNYDTIADASLRIVLERLNKGLVDELDSTDLLIGHAYFIGKTESDLCSIMNNSIIPLLYEYFYDNAKKVKDQVKKAIDGFAFELEDTKIGRIRLKKKI